MKSLMYHVYVVETKKLKINENENKSACKIKTG